MNQVICPLDNLPCEKDCPDRYKDEPEGGCYLTTAQELGGSVLDFGGGTVGLLFAPSGGSSWTLDMLFEIEPALERIAAAAAAQRLSPAYNGIAVYEAVKDVAWNLVGWCARDPRLRNSEAWDCYFRQIWRQLKI